MEARIRVWLLFLLMLATAPAHAVLTVRITQGVESALPIAIVPFAAPPSGPLPLELAEVVMSDLAGTGRFAPMAVEDLPARPHDFEAINFADWRLLGMENLLIGRIEDSPTGGYEVQFRLVDVYKGSQLLGYRVHAGRGDLRLAAHRISDMVYEKLTGERGAFSTRIAYVEVIRDAGGQKRHMLKIADSDGANDRVLVESPEPLLSPAWTPDGEKIAYVSFEGRKSAIYLQELRSGQRRKLADYPGLNSAPAFSPDGRYLAMTLSKDGNPDIYLLNLDSGRLQRMTSNPAIDTEPAWSPDGHTLAFTSDRGGSPQIYKVDALGGRPQRVSFKGGYNARPRYAPDGRHLAMVHGGPRGYQIAVLDLESGELTTLTDGPLDESPSYAPNGSMIIYATGGTGGSELAAVSADGRVRKRLGLQEGEVREPAWGPFRRP
ncbi:MAG: Tol-Pal system beta propeller repeat protein TolB [Gammaproteobacteria bacterium]|nr:MAG: Tol-Pal system beta propeller repeat protein TolB [Gammaproteobacteria bacterium]